MPKKPEDDDDDVSSVEIDDEEEEKEEDEEAANDLGNADIVTKYRTAGDIANKVLLHVISKVAVGVPVLELCTTGDAFIEEETKKVYNKKVATGKPMEKGSAFPVCISVNNCVGHYSPLSSESTLVLEKGDLVKIDLGVHIDGYIAVVAHSVIAGAEDDPVDGRRADVIQAAWTASELAHRMLKQGTTNTEITAMVAKVAKDFKVTPVEGVLSHQMKKHVIDANKVIINKTSEEHQVKEHTVELNDVFGFDVVMSTGEGKPKQKDDRTTVFKRDLEEKYSLKMKASRAFFTEVNTRFPTLPFTLRAGDERSWRLGVVECVKHGLFIEYPVLHESKGEYVAQAKFTVLLLPSGNVARITSAPPPAVQSENSLQDEELVGLLAQTTDNKKKKKQNKKKNKNKGEGGEGDQAAEEAS